MTTARLPEEGEGHGQHGAAKNTCKKAAPTPATMAEVSSDVCVTASSSPDCKAVEASVQFSVSGQSNGLGSGFYGSYAPGCDFMVATLTIHRC